jgi:hypothetical protein
MCCVGRTYDCKNAIVVSAMVEQECLHTADQDASDQFPPRHVSGVLSYEKNRTKLFRRRRNRCNSALAKIIVHTT